MSRRIAVVVIMLISATTLLGGCGYFSDEKNSSNDKIVFRFAESMPSSHPSAKASKAFCDNINENSDGRIEVRIQYEGDLGNEEEALEQLQFGGIAFIRINLLTLANEIPAFEKYLDPYKYRTPDEVIEAIKKDYESIQDILHIERIILIDCLYPDKRYIAVTDKNLSTIDDIESLRIGLPDGGILSKMFARLNADPMISSNAEIFASIENGYINSAEMGLMEYYTSDFKNIMPYITRSTAVFSPDLILAGTVPMVKLDNKDQLIIRESSDGIFSSHKEELLIMQNEAIAELVDSGTKISEAVDFNNDVKEFLDGK